MSKGSILITPRAFAKSGAAQVQRIIDAGWDVVVNDTGKSYTHETFTEYAKKATGIIIGVDNADAALLKACPNLKAIAKYGVGVDNIDVDTAKALGIEVSRTVGSNSSSVAEHAIALMYACAKNISRSALDVKQGGWTKDYGIELDGKTLGIVGFGNIGKHVARLAQGIGMNVCAYDLFPIDAEYAKEHDIKVVDFDTLVASADVITLHLPLTPETENLINSKTIDAMKDNVIIVNAARGGVVNEADLLTKLNEGKVFAAGFDVYSSEPPKPHEALVNHERFILTAHTASKTLEADMKTMEMAVDNILKGVSN